MDEEQLFAFDTWGFLTVEDALTPEQVVDLKATVDEKGPDLHSQHADRGGFWSQGFFELLDAPAVSGILDQIYGGLRAGGLPPFRIDHINVHTHGTFNKDLAGGTIHGGNGRLLDPSRPHELVTHYYERDADGGTFANGLVTVAFELEDTVCNGGGFGCLAGSHKGHYRVPEAWVDLSMGVHPMVTSVPAPRLSLPRPCAMSRCRGRCRVRGPLFFTSTWTAKKPIPGRKIFLARRMLSRGKTSMSVNARSCRRRRSPSSTAKKEKLKRGKHNEKPGDLIPPSDRVAMRRRPPLAVPARCANP